MGDAGVQPHIIEAVINHVSGDKAGVAGIYNRSTYENEKGAALEALGNYVRVPRKILILVSTSNCSRASKSFARLA